VEAATCAGPVEDLMESWLRRLATFPQVSHRAFEIAPQTPRFQHPFGKPSEDSGFPTAPHKDTSLCWSFFKKE
jgi:hypothetical protein